MADDPKTLALRRMTASLDGLRVEVAMTPDEVAAAVAAAGTQRSPAAPAQTSR